MTKNSNFEDHHMNPADFISASERLDFMRFLNLYFFLIVIYLFFEACNLGFQYNILK